MPTKKKSFEDAVHKLSRTRKKKQDRELQKLGEHLVTLSTDQVAGLPLPQDLAEAVIEAKNIRQHGAKRRQMQYIGVLMRNCDPAPIRSAVEALTRSSHEDVKRFKQVEKWRDHLIAGDDDLLEKILKIHGSLKRDELVALVLEARKEKGCLSSTKSAKALFRYLNAAVNEI